MGSALVLCQMMLPRPSRAKLAVEIRDLSPQEREREIEAKRRDLFVKSHRRRSRRNRDSRNLGALAQRGQPRREVAEAVRKVGIVRRRQAINGEIGVFERPSMTEEEVANGVGAEVVDVLHGIDRVASRLADLRASNRQVVVHQDVGGQGQSSGQQHGGPIHRVEPEHPLADHVNAAVSGGPPAGQVIVAGDPVIRPRLATGGDDYELLFATPTDAVEPITALSSRLGVPIARIGRIEPGSGVRLVDADGRAIAVDQAGYRHF